MTYKITASERTSASASEMETKAMLYLFCDDDEGKIHGFAIDFFNDVTGVDRNALHLYDIQSKGNDAGPADLGRETVTLFKNYVSEFKDYFVERILFVRRIRRSVINNKDLTKFQYADMDESAQQKLRKSLINSCKEKTYVPNNAVTDTNIDSFLNKVDIVVSKKNGSDYIRPLIHTIKPLTVTEHDLSAIFNEIRKKQLGLKSFHKVEGIEIKSPSAAYTYGRVMQCSDIELMILSRLINKNPITAGVPTPFIRIFNSFEPDCAKGIIRKCQNALAKQMFTKREAQAFWNLFGMIVKIIKNNPNLEVEDIYQKIDEKTLEACQELDTLSHQYFIALVKERLEND